MSLAPLDMLRKCRDHFEDQARFGANAGEREIGKRYVRQIDATLRDWK